MGQHPAASVDPESSVSVFCHPGGPIPAGTVHVGPDATVSIYFVPEAFLHIRHD